MGNFIYVFLGIFVSLFAFVAFRWRLLRLRYQTVNKELKDLRAKIRITQAQDGAVSLPLATTRQIIEELKRRPNTHFLLLIPRQKKEESFVETHFVNVDASSALLLLRIAYEGVYKSLDEPPDYPEQIT